jgi:sugar phosphate permease
MSGKNMIRFGGGAIGLIDAAAVGHWKNLAGPIQMAMYSALTVGILLIGVWSDRQRPRFPIAICAMLAAHCLILFAIRSLFPFRTFLVIVPYIFIFMEGILLFILMLKIFGDGQPAGGT